MKKKIIRLLPFLCIAGLLSFILKKYSSPETLVLQSYSSSCISFEQSVDSMYQSIREKTFFNEQDITDLKNRLNHCKKIYKKTEAFTEYFFPATAEAINGPLVNEADEEEGTQHIIVPEGLQVIQDLVYNGNINGEIEVLKMEVLRLHQYARRLSFVASTMKMENWQIFEALKMQVIRIYILSFSGYDAPSEDHILEENITALESLQYYLVCYKKQDTEADKEIATCRRLIKSCIQYLRKKEYEHIDRVFLTREYMNPLFAGIEKIKQALHIVSPALVQPVNMNATSLWNTGSYNLNYYSRYDKGNAYNTTAVTLGKLLFYDPVLSSNGLRSCASCHQPQHGFADQQARSLPFDTESKQTILRNAPTLWNVGFQSAYFYDARAAHLEDQVRIVVESPDEMHGNLSDAGKLLKLSPQYKQLFNLAFAGTVDTNITTNSILRAISAYERSLFSMNSKFDKHIRNEGEFLTKNEINGYNIFMGKALCGTCHFPPVFNGTLPPNYIKTEWEVIGTPSSADSKTATLDPDQGRGAVNHLWLNNFAFKTPGLRNIALTAPYMHNGVFNTLEEVMEFYNDGGGNGRGFTLENQTLPFDSLLLTPQEIKDVISFLHTLTDTTGTGTAPAFLPVIEGHPELNDRKIGGKY